MEAIAIWGASGHGRVVLDAIRCASQVRVAGFVDDDPKRKGERFAGSVVLGGREVLAELLAQGVRRVHVAVGHCATRSRIARALTELGFGLCTVTHPTSVIARDASVADGTFAAANVVVNSGATVGRLVILNTACVVDHDSRIGDAVHVAPGSTLGGLVQVGEETFIGIGATVINCVSIGSRSVVGAGAIVVNDLPDDVVAYGVPARVMRARGTNE